MVWVSASIACWILGPGAVSAQTPGAPPAAAAGAAMQSELAALREMAQAWFDCNLRYDAATNGAKRAALAKERLAAKATFLEAMAHLDTSRPQPLLLDAAGLRTVFQDVLRPAAPPETIGRTTFDTAEGLSRAVLVPSDYDLGKACPTVLLLADREHRATPESLQAFLAATWFDAAVHNATIVVAPAAPGDLEFDAPGEVPHPEAA
jgi:hypothetical protein